MFCQSLKSLNNSSASVFNTWFSFSSDQHNYETSSFIQVNLIKLFYKTNKYGKYTITLSAVESWNKIQKQLKDMLFEDLTPTKLKQLSVVFILHLFNTSLIMQKLYMAFISSSTIREIISIINYTCQVSVCCIVCCNLIVKQ